MSDSENASGHNGSEFEEKRCEGAIGIRERLAEVGYTNLEIEEVQEYPSLQQILSLAEEREMTAAQVLGEIKECHSSAERRVEQAKETARRRRGALRQAQRRFEEASNQQWVMYPGWEREDGEYHPEEMSYRVAITQAKEQYDEALEEAKKCRREANARRDLCRVAMNAVEDLQGEWSNSAAEEFKRILSDKKDEMDMEDSCSATSGREESGSSESMSRAGPAMDHQHQYPGP